MIVQNSSEYQSTSNTAVQNKSTTTNDETSSLVSILKVISDSIHPLKLFEGDTLLQSRFGQSIRFSGYNNSEKLHPSIIIRNRENNNSQNELEKGSHTEEDINKDGSIISLTSGEFKLDFQPVWLVTKVLLTLKQNQLFKNIHLNWKVTKF